MKSATAGHIGYMDLNFTSISSPGPIALYLSKHTNGRQFIVDMDILKWISSGPKSRNNYYSIAQKNIYTQSSNIKLYLNGDSSPSASILNKKIKKND